jgi:hypothetical protein
VDKAKNRDFTMLATKYNFLHEEDRRVAAEHMQPVK